MNQLSLNLSAGESRMTPKQETRHFGRVSGRLDAGSAWRYVRSATIERLETSKCTITVQSLSLPCSAAALTFGADNSGHCLVSAYRGIGSETVRRPVVIAGRDPNKAMADLTALYRSPSRNSYGSP